MSKQLGGEREQCERFDAYHEKLETENAELHQLVQLLQRQVDFLTKHKTLAAGLSGEALISKIVDGHMTTYAASFDILDRRGKRIEVKYSRLNTSVQQQITKRWAWGKIFGEGGVKDFDYLVLVGERDERHSSLYRDPSSPYVLFCVPRPEVEPFTMPMNGGRYRSIQITSNPEKASRSRASHLFTKYQVTSDELKEMFGL